MRNYLPLLLLMFLLVSCLKEDPEAIDPAALDKWEYFDMADGLADDFVLDILQDNDGNYWFATANGLSFYDGKDFTTYPAPDVLLDSYVTSVEEDENGAIWVGSPGGANVYLNRQWYSIPSVDGHPWEIQDIEKTEDGLLWFATTTLGTLIYDGNSFYQLFDDTCNNCNVINKIYQTSDGKIWIGSEQDLKVYSLNGQYKKYDRLSGMEGNRISAIYEDRRGDVWVGFFDSNSISKYSGRDFDRVRLIEAFPEVPVTSFANGPDGSLWIGTLVNNVIYYDGLVIRTLFERLPSNTVFSFFEEEGAIWVGTDSGIAKYVTP